MSLPAPAHLHTFLVVAEELNITRAATRLHLAQQAVSAQIRTLERTIGVTLLVRTSRGVELTSAGTELAKSGAELLTEFTRVVERVRAAAHGLSGRLRLVCKPHATHEFALAVTEAMETELPELEIELVTVSTLSEELGLLTSGGADACFLWLPVGADALHSEPVRRDRRMVALPQRHPLADRTAVTLAELADDPVVTGQAAVPEEVRRHWLAEPRPHGRPAVRGPAVDRIEDRILLVARGKGVFFAPEPLAGYFPPQGVRWVPVTDAEPSVLALVWTRRIPAELVTRLLTVVRSITGWDQNMAPLARTV
ncbi:LysR family transcriptional regulator [Nocardia sp. alder85J]|uniref:LysR substrate-binding domain-containing protein n=1 Tax=Nocardia sp. alder85J TaxID=2862949 RepID=UPI001CD7F6DF|nr:LysR family transcriptional regulator [Nocardia sp. alder85J]MCX4096881.1 LysR family transcriptional regulator [Nocardia sp. alder85J]